MKTAINISLALGVTLKARIFENLSISYETNMLQVSHLSTFYFLRYAHVRCAKTFRNVKEYVKNNLTFNLQFLYELKDNVRV